MCANKVHSRKRTPTPLSKLQEVDSKIGHHDPPKGQSRAPRCQRVNRLSVRGRRGGVDLYTIRVYKRARSGLGYGFVIQLGSALKAHYNAPTDRETRIAAVSLKALKQRNRR